MKQFEEFAEAVKNRESGGGYGVVNKFGFLGAYQFGKPRLYDLGYSIDGYAPKGRPKKKVISKQEFLQDRELQDKLFFNHVRMLKLYITNNMAQFIGIKLIQDGESFAATLSGLIAGAHLVGLGGLRKFLQGENVEDGFGTSPLEYITKFSGFDL